MGDDSPLLLLVEDDPNDVLLFQRALRKVRSGTKVLVARDGDEAVRLVAGQEEISDRTKHPLPTHVVLDFKLPRRSGLEVLDWIRSRPEIRDLPVVVLSSSKEPSDLRRAEKAGIGRYFVNPPGFDDLLEIVKEIVTGWRLLP